MQLIRHKLPAPTTYQHQLSELFAKEIASKKSVRQDYVNKGSYSISKMQNDVYMGKMAEFAVWNWLKSINKNATFPDVSIYDYTDNNFFGADITFDSTKLHVKSCMAVSTYPNSWVFHPSDNLIHSPTPDDFLALVTLNHDKNFDAYVIKAELVTSIYDEPRKPNTPKKVIYEERLMSLYNKL